MELSRREWIAGLFLRLGLAFVLFYVAWASYVDPNSWIGFFPQWLRRLIPAEPLLALFSGYEIVLGLWLLSGWKIGWSSLFMALTMFGIVAFNLGAMPIVFRDIAIGCAAFSLSVIYYGRR